MNKKNDDITSRSFAAANFASILPEFRNKEQDIVRNAFNGGNYQSLRDMPDKFDTQAVSAARNMKAARNLKTIATPKKMSFKKMYFQYEHMADRFSLVDELNSQVLYGEMIYRFCCDIYNEENASLSRIQDEKHICWHMQERVANQTKRLTLHGAEFALTRKARVPKHQDPFVTEDLSSKFRSEMTSRLR